MFYNNLNYIMNITRTQASALGKMCGLDPSYISRLRNGSRRLPKRPDFLDTMASYFAGRVVTDYQKAAMCDAMRIDAFPKDKRRAAALIKRWLCAEEDNSPNINELLASFSDPSAGGGPAVKNKPLSEKAKNCYYGAKGKQEAILHFFDMILREKEPQTLLLLSEEEMDWLYEDPAFAARWAEDLTKILMKGNNARIIHTIGRSMNEMLEAVAKWLPVYTTGKIEPYYYPKLRDGIFRRTLFIAPKTAAVISASVERRTDGMLNQLITDPGAVSALSLEFENFLSLCRPLMSITTAQRSREMWESCRELIASEGDMLCMSDMPTLITMPESVARSMQERVPESDIFEQWQLIQATLKKRRKTQYTELLPKFGRDMEVPLPCADLLGAEGLRYTKEEWNAHIEASASYAARHRRYSQVRVKDTPKNVCLFVKEGRGVVMTRTAPPGTSFAFSEVNMVNSFADHMKRLAQKGEKV